MAEYVLDTHACLFALGEPSKLGRRAKVVLTESESGTHQIWIPAAVVAEVVMLRELDRVGIGLRELIAAIDEAPSLRFLPLDLAQLDEFAALMSVRDPFDRLILSAARVRRAKLITRDRSLSEQTLVPVVWS